MTYPARGETLSEIPSEDHLTCTINMVIILRLVLEPSGNLSHGEILDMDSNRIEYFNNWSDLTWKLRHWFDSRKSEVELG